tara:strand:- start:13 stop:495 length:483 start_codon:yes stop_codon:yes gene_type:complete
MDNLIEKMKNSKKLKTFKRKQDTYKFMSVIDYNDLKPLTYTILLKKTKIITEIDGKIETTQELDRGDYVLCGRKNEKFGHKLEKILNLFNLGIIKNKLVKRKGFKLTKKNLNKNIKGKKIVIKPSWGGEQILKENDYILYEIDKTGYYGIEEGAFKKTYI